MPRKVLQKLQPLQVENASINFVARKRFTKKSGQRSSRQNIDSFANRVMIATLEVAIANSVSKYIHRATIMMMKT